MYRSSKGSYSGKDGYGLWLLLVFLVGYPGCVFRLYIGADGDCLLTVLHLLAGY